MCGSSRTSPASAGRSATVRHDAHVPLGLGTAGDSVPAPAPARQHSTVTRLVQHVLQPRDLPFPGRSPRRFPSAGRSRDQGLRPGACVAVGRRCVFGGRDEETCIFLLRENTCHDDRATVPLRRAADRTPRRRERRAEGSRAGHAHPPVLPVTVSSALGRPGGGGRRGHRSTSGLRSTRGPRAAGPVSTTPRAWAAGRAVGAQGPRGLESQEASAAVTRGFNGE